MSDVAENDKNDTSASELESIKKEAELAKKEAELAKKEAELAKKEASDAKNNSGSKEKGGKKKTIIIIIAALIIIALIAIIIYLLEQKGIINLVKDDPVPNIVTEENVDDIIGQLDEEITPPGKYAVSMTTSWNFKNGTAISKNAYLENVKTNNCSVYATVEIEDTGEQIYKSPILKRGSHVDNIKLDEDLGRGVYQCVCTYHLLNKDETDVESTTRVSVKVIVKK